MRPETQERLADEIISSSSNLIDGKTEQKTFLRLHDVQGQGGPPVHRTLLKTFKMGVRALINAFSISASSRLSVLRINDTTSIHAPGTNLDHRAAILTIDVVDGYNGSTWAQHIKCDFSLVSQISEVSLFGSPSHSAPGVEKDERTCSKTLPHWYQGRGRKKLSGDF